MHVNDIAVTANGGLRTINRPRTISRWRTALARRSESLARPAEFLLRFSILVREAFPVGLLREHEIEHVVREAYREFPDFYDPDEYHLRYEDKLLPVLEKQARGKRLLDLYCGHGREAAIFAGAGFDVFGVDEDAQSVEKARAYLARSELQAEFIAANVNQWQPARTDWDVIYSSLWMYSCMPGRAARLHWLKRVSHWLQPQGVLVISVTPRISERAARVRKIIARVVSFASLNGRRIELGDRFHTRLFWHDFANSDVESELAQAGLRTIDTLEIGGSTPCTFFLAKSDASGT